MKILQIAIGFEGGIGKLLVDYCTKMKGGIEFEFLVGTYENGRYEKELKNNGFTIHHILVSASKEEKRKVLNDILKDAHFDAIHIHGVCDYVFLKCAKRNKVKTRIVHSHNASVEMRYKNPFYKTCRNIYRAFNNWLYVTDKWACGIEAGKALWGEAAVNNNQVFIMPNAIQTKNYTFDESIRKRMRLNLGIDQEAIVVGSVGRLTYQKNQSLMLDIMSEIKKTFNNIYLVMIGEGELEEKLKHKAIECGIDKNIKWLGNRNDVAQLLNAMDVFILTSHYEGLPVVMIEAQANGLPCVVSNEITKECDFLNSNKYLSLTSSFREWADAVLKAAVAGRNQNAQNIIIEHGYELKVAVEVLKKKYSEVIKTNAYKVL